MQKCVAADVLIHPKAEITSNFAQRSMMNCNVDLLERRFLSSLVLFCHIYGSLLRAAFLGFLVHSVVLSDPLLLKALHTRASFFFRGLIHLTLPLQGFFFPLHHKNPKHPSPDLRNAHLSLQAFFISSHLHSEHTKVCLFSLFPSPIVPLIPALPLRSYGLLLTVNRSRILTCFYSGQKAAE